MKLYIYSDINLVNELDTIHIEIASSLMTDKSISYCIWKELDLSLEVYLENELNSSDKIILDTIIAGVH